MDPETPAPTSALRFDGIEKSFFGVRVLTDITFDLREGHTLGLVGENGAGKSTLMNILGGNLRPDAGYMLLRDEPYAPVSPRDAESCGIAFVHQELNLFGNLSIAENLHLSAFPRRAGFIDRRRMRQRTWDTLRQIGLEIEPDLPIDRLSTGERQLVEIAKALMREARLIILDEPTTSLTDHETAKLFDILGHFRRTGKTLIYISHALEDVMRLADDILVLRDGAVVDYGAKERFDIPKMISAMVGRKIEQLFPTKSHKPTQQVALEVNSLTKKGVLKNASFKLHRGEVLGISGLMGSGRTDLARILFGLDPTDSGDIRLDGASLLELPPRKRVAAGMAFLTEDRRAEGLCLDASIDDNLTLICASRESRGVYRWLKRENLESDVSRIRNEVKLTPSASGTQAVKTLSGGNQQKVVLAKWLLNQPRVVILDEPTRGVDVGAKFEIYSLIDKLTAQGAAVLVISSELEELIGICDRILTMRQGEITGTFDREHFEREVLLEAVLH